MGNVIEHLQQGLIVIFMEQLFVALFLDRAQLKCRQLSLLARVGVEPIIWPGPATVLCFYLLMFGWYSVRMVYDFSGRPGGQTTESATLFWKISLAAICAGTLLIFTAMIRFASRVRTLGDYRLSRGQFLKAVNELSRRGKFLKLVTRAVYVLPDNDFGKLCARMGGGVALPRSLLDQLTRREVDALVARQLCMQSGKFYFPAFWVLLVCNVAAVCLVQKFQVAPLPAALTYVSLLIGELFTFTWYLPSILFRADLRAIDLIGDAEVFFSALGGLSRLTGVPVQESVLWRIGRKKAVSPERIRDLLAERVTNAEDRYPTTGSYMDTGL
jgi:hypothetical protein